MDIKLIRDLSD